MAELNSSDFRRCLEPDVDILDPCWFCETVVRRTRHTGFSHPRTRLVEEQCDVFVAGKSEGPDHQCLTAAASALKMVDELLPETGVDENEWRFSTVWVPYQFVPVFYLGFLSEYGAELELAFKLESCRYGNRGICSPERSTIATIPVSVAYVVREIRQYCSLDCSWLKLAERIQNEKIMGPEIVSDLIRIVREQRSQLPDPEQLQNLLDECVRIIAHAEDRN